MNNWRLGAAVFTASITLAQVAAHADSRVGVTSAVNPSAAGTPPGAASRQLTVGSDIQFRERVITTTDGQAQILFLDQSSLLIGPNSTVVIDEFVYDPATNKGNIAATLTQGSFRYIGGKLSKQGNATLKTPVATLGIRGSDVTVGYDASSAHMNVVTTHGTASLQTATDTLTLRGGFGTTVSGGQAATPTALTAQQIAAANGQFEGQPGKNAGAGKPPSDGDVAKSGLSSSVEAKGLASIEPGAGGAPGGAPLQAPFTPSNNDTPQGIVPPPPPPPAPSLSVTRTDRTMNGYVAGSAVISGGGHVIINETPSDVTVRTVPDANDVGRVSAVFGFHPAGHNPARETRIEFGDPPNTPFGGRSTFTDDTQFDASQAAGANAGKAQIDGVNVSVTATMSSVAITTPVSSVLGVGNAGPACECQFVNWGVWIAILRAESISTRTVPQGFWVAGVLPSVNDPSPQGTAIFGGTAIGIVMDGAQPRAASGSFTNDYNFAQRSGTVTISNFDGKSFGGTVTAGSDWRSYSGALAGSNLTGTLNGSFYGNRTAAGQLQVPKETAGNFNVQGSGYKAGGIFLGSR